MSQLLPLLAPTLLLLASAAGFREPGRRPANVPLLAEGAALGAFAVALVAAGMTVANGAATSPLIGLFGVGLSARLDAVSMTMLVLVSFVGWIVVRYARTYMDGEARQGLFTAWLTATLAAVLLLVQAGNLVQLVAAWFASSWCLRQLLVFYPERVQAQRAARKKALSANTGAAVLVVAGLLLAWHYGTFDIATLLEAARADDASGVITVAALLLTVAALLKSAQFPLHGWLTEVMETPTPVSALLHAGLVNAGGFLLIRFADVMLLAPGVLALLVFVGGFTALFGGLVMLTQPAVKTSLAWSTVAQMGFMMLQCGLALFPLALLHIVAHSFYKAHAFLASGEGVENVTAARRPGPIAIPDGWAVTRSFLAALAIYAFVGLLFGFEDSSPQAIALGAILVFGVAYLLAQGLADEAPRILTRRTAVYSGATAIAYFVLHRGAEALTAGTLPPTPVPTSLEWALVVLAVLSFALVAWAQALFPIWAHHPATAPLRVHLSNGLYANAIADRLLGGWRRTA
ncbi:MAG: proton-conducting transporter membrane subunit [Pseudomonadales bacterium]|jgi:NADH:ubiquinone oxidoreductase subunit 5 (subunit L)/multisubunit Na+/H+ antiporter MnhA subunit|nr:proton-conducting transporter membrane subunit [Pseudomonadales bacterium]